MLRVDETVRPPRMIEAGQRILLDVTDLVSLLVVREHPTGIPRVVANCLAEFVARDEPVVPVFFCAIGRRYRRVDGRRLLARDIAYLRALLPPARDNWGRLRVWLGMSGAERVAPGPGDTLLLLGAGWGHARRHRYLFGPLAPASRVVWFCHDLIPLLYPHHAMSQEHFSAHFRTWIDAALGRAHEFICASRFVEADLRRYASQRGASPHISLVPLAHEFKPTSGALGADLTRLADENIALCVSSIGLRKNQIGLVRAWNRLHDEFGQRLPKLVLVGDIIESGELDAFLRDTGNVQGRVTLLGPVGDAGLSWLYERCVFTVFPSLNEGWGLPVGESLWMGKPCVCSSLTALPEVGGGYAVYFDPRDEADMVAALRSAVRGEFSALPPARRQLRSWRQAAADLLEAVRPGG